MQVAGLKRVLLGPALARDKLEHQLLPKILALPVFASDQLSSVAYATEQMMLVLALAGAVALSYMVPIGLAIGALLAVVITSYRQTARAYPTGGGSYIVARENLGTLPGLVAAAAIQTAYVLTVSVSVTAGSIAITSAAPGLARYKLAIALGFIALITLANLRGVKEAGRLFAFPTYGFVAIVYVTLLTGFLRCLSSCPVARTHDLELEPLSGLGVFLILRAFSSGATALTGVEAIADGVQAFRRPQAKNAAATLGIMGALSIPMFTGITLLADLLQVRTNEEIAVTKSVLAQIGETVYGGGLPFLILQAFTAGILVLAANTAYQDFPRLSAILARDRFMPAQFRNRGNRLVFSNGIVILSVLAGLMVWVFKAELTGLLHLYVIGVFVALTLSQAGMVRRWLVRKEEGWRRSIAINATGALVTGMVMVIVAVTNFTAGAWMVIVAVPFIVAFFLGVRSHYDSVRRVLNSAKMSPRQVPRNTFVILVEDLGLATTDAVAYLRAVRPERVIPLYVGDPNKFEDAASRWLSVAPRLGNLERLSTSDGGGWSPRELRAYLRGVPRQDADFLTVVLPEVLQGRSLLRALWRGRAFRLKASLLLRGRGVVVTDVPLLPEELQGVAEHAAHPVAPEHTVVLLPVSNVYDPTIRAVVYAKSLQPTIIEGLYFAEETEDVESLLAAWADRGIDIPLSAIDAPFRDIGPPLLHEVRRHTKKGDTIVNVVLPEFVVRRPWHHLLHNQTAFSIKRWLLFEPHVVVTSVPYHL